MRTSDFDYLLPGKMIASDPVMPRDRCKLMIVDRKSGSIKHDYFFNIGKYAGSEYLYVFNKSKVIPCRIKNLIDGRENEIFITKIIDESHFEAMVKPGAFFAKGKKYKIKSGSIRVVDVSPDGQRLFETEGGELETKNILSKYGSAPFPPYIKNSTALMEDYQTVYATKKGSLAAPTAGLHFTNRLLKKLYEGGVKMETIVLHVGLGTFLPIKSKQLEKHSMHSEDYELNEMTANNLLRAKKSGKKLLAVGTTSVRVLESSFKSGKFQTGRSETNIFIYPGYKWKCTDALLTNFHLPKSTLLCLVASFTGTELMWKAYDLAIRKKYRFYSFGDAMLIT